MKISYNWLTDYVSLDEPPEQIAERLTLAGLEVESVDTIGTTFEGVVVGHVLETRPHPNADRLTLCSVNLGNGDPVQIVCGAPNVAGGQKVPVATVGTTLMVPDRKNPDERVPLQLKKAKIRGERSNGMICAEDELGLGDDHSGIIVLDDDAEPGQPFGAYLQSKGHALSDHVFDIAITPNRPDAISHVGVARDLAALTGQALKRPHINPPEPGGPAAEQVSVDIEDPKGCSRYVALLVQGVRIQPSPEWLQQRLRAVGLRPRNNVVDVTNYVMYEIGQPLHAFDFDMLAGGRIVVRSTPTDQPFTTLDSKERTLPTDTVMICDADRYVAIGGIMGGENSEVTDDTTNVLIESAWFDPSRIRRSAKILGLSTDASYRFERGVDPEGQVWAATRAAELICELSGGSLVPGMVDCHPRPTQRRSVDLRLNRVEKVLGVRINREETTRLLTAIGFEINAEEAKPNSPIENILDEVKDVMHTLGITASDDSPVLRCTVPSFRPDVEREIDIIEEVARLYGYDRIPAPRHSPVLYVPPKPSSAEDLKLKTLHHLSGLGFRETYTNSLLSMEVAETFHVSNYPLVETLNPISQEMAVLRPSLLSGILPVIAHNQNHGQEVVRIMEFGHVFERTHPEATSTFIRGYREREALVVALSGLAQTAGWDTDAREADLFDLKGMVEALLNRLRLTPVQFDIEAEPPAHASFQMRIRAAGKKVGLLGCITEAVGKQFDLRAPVYYAELDWQTLLDAAVPRLKRNYVPISRFPKMERDLAVVVNIDQPAQALLNTIQKTEKRLLEDIRIFDVYEGPGIEDGKKSIAISLRFGADRTLVDKEVDASVNRIVERLQTEHNATLRQ